MAVADGATVRLFHNTGVKPGVHLVEITPDLDAAAHSGSGSRHRNTSANPDETRLAEDDFAAAVARLLNKLDLDGAIEKLVLISDPRTLGEMRKHINRNLKGKIICELAKELVGRPAEDIAASISDA